MLLLDCVFVFVFDGFDCWVAVVCCFAGLLLFNLLVCYFVERLVIAGFSLVVCCLIWFIL